MAKIVKIASFLQNSGTRFLSYESLEADPTLTAEGWERRFVADAHRVQEVTELYAELGYEVRAEPIKLQELADNCEDCHPVASSQYRTIYTRKRQA